MSAIRAVGPGSYWQAAALVPSGAPPSRRFLATYPMTIERALRGIAGAVVLLSLLLAWTLNGVTDWCPMTWTLLRQAAGV